ncbi:thioredoxin family protein [Flavobacterium psychrophilum]
MKQLKTFFFIVITMSLCSASSISGGNDELVIVKKAKDTNKYIAVYFSGSDWCSICHVFKKEFVEQKEIATILGTDYVYYNADFPQRKKLAKEIAITNDAIAVKLNPNGIFPLLVIADENLNVRKIITKVMGYDKGLLALKASVKK